MCNGITFNDVFNDVFDDDFEMPPQQDECNHLNCINRQWSNMDRIFHHACSLTSDTVYDCDTCYDMHDNETVVCKLIPRVNSDKVKSQFSRYVKELTDHCRIGLMSDIKNQAMVFQQRMLMKGTILNDLIAIIMHPSRIQKQLEMFDDIEDYFESIGC
jgi:hypothetical protein